VPELPDILLYLHALRSRVVGHRIEHVRLASEFCAAWIFSVSRCVSFSTSVRPSLDAHGTSLGAAMLVDPDMRVDMPAPVTQPDLDLGLYRARWRTFIGAKRLFGPETQFFN